MNTGVLTSRAPGRRGRCLDEVLVVAAPAPADTWVVYVHGSNVSREDAVDQVEELHRRSRSSIVTGAGSVAWIAYSWPAQMTGLRLVDKVFYPVLVSNRVLDAGTVLGDHLARVGVRRIVLVGNSLGAHVALEAARRMKELDRPPDGLALLAAAVETRLVEHRGTYGIPHTSHEAVTVNPDDPVLRTFFAPGQRVAAPWMRPSMAVGLTGDPAERRWLRVRLHGADHASYAQDHVEEAVAAACAARMTEPVGRVVAGRYVPGMEPPGLDGP